MSIDIKPHAYDPAAQPELFEGVLPRRVVAFAIDFVIIAAPIVLAAYGDLRLRGGHLGARLGALLAAAARLGALGDCYSALRWRRLSQPPSACG